jgi:hypothetical protein
MSNRFRLRGVDNTELLAGLSQLVQRGNELTAEVLAHLAELEERMLHLQLGFASLFAYCVEGLGLSEGAAGRRVAAARVCRRFPEAFELVARGDLHLSALCALGLHLKPENASELFTACCRKTRRQVDELLAARFPKPDVREQIRRLPVPVPVPVTMPVTMPAPALAAEPRITGRLETLEEAVREANATGQRLEAPPAQVAELAGKHGSEMAPSLVGSPPARRREVEALSADRFGVHFTADAELKELLDRARALASHRLPKNDLSSLMRLVLTSFVKHEQARRFAVGKKPRRAQADSTQAKADVPRAKSAATRGAPPGGVSNPDKRHRYVSATVRRAVYVRDHARCSFVAADGRQCEARSMLELDHVEPWAALGGAGVENIRLLCRAHNQLHARECFGVGHVTAKISAAALRRRRLRRRRPPRVTINP